MYSELKDSISIIEVAGKNNISVSRNAKALCPFHGDKKHPNLSFKGKIFKCFACDAKGDMYNLVERLYGITRHESLELIKAQFGIISNNISYVRKENTYDKQKELEKQLLELELSYIVLDKRSIEIKPAKGEYISDEVIDLAKKKAMIFDKIKYTEATLWKIKKSNIINC